MKQPTESLREALDDLFASLRRDIHEHGPLLLSVLGIFGAVALFIALAALVSGCAAPEPQVRLVREPVEVRVPVPVACVRADQVPRLPPLAGDAALAGLADYDLVLALEQQRRLLRAHSQQTDALLAACARSAPPPPTKE